GDEDLLAVEQGRDLARPPLTQGEVADHAHLVLRPNHLVPAADQGAVHLLDRLERPRAVLDHVVVPDVQVAGDPGGHFLPAPLASFSTSAARPSGGTPSSMAA